MKLLLTLILTLFIAPVALADFTDSVFQYNSLTGDCRWIGSGNSTYVLDIDSASASFIPAAMHYPAGYDVDFSGIDPTSFSVEAVGASFGDFDFGNILPSGIDARADLSGVYGVDGILGNQPIVVETVGTPDPSTLLPLLGLLLCRRRKISP